MEDLVEAVPARVDLQGVGEEDEDGDGELADGDEERVGGVHGDDVGADGGPEGEVAEDGDDFVGEGGGADGGPDDDVHPFLSIRAYFVEDGEKLVDGGYINNKTANGRKR